MNDGEQRRTGGPAVSSFRHPAIPPSRHPAIPPSRHPTIPPSHRPAVLPSHHPAGPSFPPPPSLAGVQES